MARGTSKHEKVPEREPNDSADHAQRLTLPTVVCGRFDRPGDADWYAVHLKAGEGIAVELWCERLGLPGDPFVIVTDAKGRELAEPLYTIAFRAADLWPEAAASRDRVFADLWESYLER